MSSPPDGSDPDPYGIDDDDEVARRFGMRPDDDAGRTPPSGDSDEAIERLKRRHRRPEPVVRDRRPGTTTVTKNSPVLVVALVVALLGAGGLGYLAYFNNVSANEWQVAAEEAEAELEQERDAHRQTEVALTAEQEAHSRTSEALVASEADVTRLENRIDELANEKAQVEDDREVIRVERDVMVDLVDLTQTTGDWLDDCVSYMYELHDFQVQAFNDYVAYDIYPNVGTLNDLSETTFDFCSEGQSWHAQSVDLAEQILAN